MLRSAKNLIGFTVETTSGKGGKVCDLLLSQRTWKVKYVVLNLGLWTLGREILVPLKDLTLPDGALRRIRVCVAREQLLNYPGIENDMPVSMQQKLRMHNYYHWDTPVFWGDIHTSFLPDIPVTASEKAQIRKLERTWDPELHRTKEVLHYHGRTSSEDFGKIQDMFLDDSDWKIEFFILGLAEGPAKRERIVTPRMVKEISWAQRAVLFENSKTNNFSRIHGRIEGRETIQ